MLGNLPKPQQCTAGMLHPQQHGCIVCVGGVIIVIKTDRSISKREEVSGNAAHRILTVRWAGGGGGQIPCKSWSSWCGCGSGHSCGHGLHSRLLWYQCIVDSISKTLSSRCTWDSWTIWHVESAIGSLRNHSCTEVFMDASAAMNKVHHICAPTTQEMAQAAVLASVLRVGDGLKDRMGTVGWAAPLGWTIGCQMLCEFWMLATGACKVQQWNRGSKLHPHESWYRMHAPTGWPCIYPPLLNVSLSKSSWTGSQSNSIQIIESTVCRVVDACIPHLEEFIDAKIVYSVQSRHPKVHAPIHAFCRALVDKAEFER